MVGQEAEFAAEAGESAGMTHPNEAALILVPTQAGAVARHPGHGMPLGVVEILYHRNHLPRAVHFSPGGAFQRTGIGAVARWPGIEVEGCVAGEVFESGDQSTHGAPTAVVQQGFGFPTLVFPTVSQRQLIGGNFVPFVDRIGHAQWLEDPTGDVGLIGLSGHAGHDSAKQRIAQVAVFPAGACGRGGGQASRYEGVELGVGLGQLAVAPRVVLWKSARHPEQVPHGEGRGVRGRGLDVAKLGQVLRNRVFEEEFTRIPQLEDGRRSDAF